MIGFREMSLDQLAVDHRLDVNTLTGSAQLLVPLRTSPGRESFGPSLALGYSSGQKNSTFGVGWFLSGVPSIGLDTTKELPRYDRAVDRYTYAGGQQLVPMLREEAGAWLPVIHDVGPHRVQRFRNKTERSFERFERWTHQATGRVHWIVYARNGVVSVFGRAADDSTRVADPSDPDHRTFQWLLEAQYHPKGNAIVFQYKPEDGAGVDVTSSFEAARARLTSGFAQRYLKRILYGNSRPLSVAQPDDAGNEWRFEVVFDYGEHSMEALPVPSDAAPAPPWAVRTDAFSTHRPGFELRTYRLCRRILMFHRFPELNGGSPCVIGATELTHRHDSAGTIVEAIAYRGYRRNTDGTTSDRGIPALALRYTEMSVGSAFEATSPADNIPAGVDGAGYQWMDVNSEGLAGVLFRHSGSWYFKENLGGGRFGPMNVVTEVPAAISAAFDLQDFDGDGNLDLVGFEGREAGHYQHDRERGLWEGFRAFQDVPRIDLASARAQWVDLNGDGYTDLIVERSDRLSWYPSEGANGFAPAVELAKPDVHAGGAPTLVQRAALQTFFADMTGDGMLDMVRVDAGRVEYWPNLGLGEFGPGVVMEDPPNLDAFGEVDPRRLRLVDLDGSGTADLLYIGRGEIRFWINQSGNRFGGEQRLTNLPYIDRLASAQILDFLGNGTRCLVWSTALPSHEGHAIQYLPLTADLPPRLLVSVANGLGRETRVSYRYSAEEYLRDKNTEHPWRTRLPRHSMVVQRLEAIDHIGGDRLVTRYEYRDGYFDDDERRFVGFGLVDAFDSDQIPAGGEALAEDVAPPSVARTWYHTGEDGGFHTRAQDFYQGDPLAAHAPPPELTDVFALTTAEQLDAYRAIAGAQWRQELYAIGPDGTREPHPFRTKEFAYRMRRLQPAFDERDAAFAIEQSEAITHEYERNSSDPRVTHDVLLTSDDFGNVEARAELAYPRRPGGPAVRPEQQVLHAALIQLVQRNIDTASRYEVGIEVEERRYALGGINPAAGSLFSRADLAAQVELALAAAVTFHEAASPAEPHARMIGYRRSRFWNDTQTAAADAGHVGAVTLLHHVERAVFPELSVDPLFEGRVDGAMLADDGHYRLDGGFWWAEDTTVHYRDAMAFFRLREETSPTGARQLHTFDPHWMMPLAVEDVFGNRVVGAPDYQALALSRMTDANDNLSEALYDPLGIAIATSLRGSQLGSDGHPYPVGDDALSAYVPVAGATTADVLANPAAFLQGATQFFFYDVEAFGRGDGPPRSISLEREQHRHDGEGSAPGITPILTRVQYLDGFGRDIQSKVREGPDRWLTGGHRVFNTRGWLARTYEPRFAATSDFESAAAVLEFGVAIHAHFDPLGRIVREDLPNGTFKTTEYSSWAAQHADANDNVVGSAYEAEREALPVSDVQRRALDKARAHANTFTVVETDPAGRPLRLVEIGLLGVERVTTTVYGPLGLPDRVVDPRGLTAFTYRYDMLGRPLLDHSMDAGRRWTLLDTEGHAVHQWDAVGVHARRRFDENGRYVELRVDGATEFDGAVLANRLVEQVTYGDNPEIPQAQLRNARGRAIRWRDDGGVVRFDRYSIDGRVLEQVRSFRSSYKGTVDWSDPAAVSMIGDEHRSRTRFDALGRVVAQYLPDGTTRELTHARLGHVSEVLVSTADGVYDRKVIASDIQVNPREQRTQIVFGNGVQASYEYDGATFRLARLYGHRVAGGPRDYLDVAYTYDPAGNITHWIDRVQDPGAPVPLLTGLTVSSACEFTYDAFYQLMEATGRVHQALLQHDHRPQHITLDNGAAVERYTRIYEYDLAGNIRSIGHQGTTHNWTTEIWTSPTSNRSLPQKDLDGVDIADSEARFDGNGNVVRFPHLRAMNWNFGRRLSRVVIIDRSGSGQPDDAEYYVYGADGLRVRRITERLVAGQLEATDTIYLDGCEVRRIALGGATRLLRQTSHITDGFMRLATLHQWSVDQTGLETDDVTAKKLHYLIGNHLGSVSLELDDAANVISYEEYFPFGATSFLAGPNARDAGLKEYRYSGKCRDDATGLYYYGYRYYAPFIGNWISPDPLGPMDGLNLYRFVNNNPIRFIDAMGLVAAVSERDLGATDQPGPVRQRPDPERLPPPPRPPPTPPPPPRQRPPGEGNPNPNPGGGRPRPPGPAPQDSGPQPGEPPANPEEGRDAPAPGGGEGEPEPRPIPPAPADETEEPGPHFSECECHWVEAGWTTDWETLAREGRVQQVWQDRHLECSGPPTCRQGGGTLPDLRRREGGATDETGRGQGHRTGPADGGGDAAAGDGRTGGREGERGAARRSGGGAQAGTSSGGPDAAGQSSRRDADAHASPGAPSQSTSEEVDRTGTTPIAGDQRSAPGTDRPSEAAAGADATATSGQRPGEGYTRTDNGGPVTLGYSAREQDDRPIPWDRVTDVDWLSFAPLALDAVQVVLDVVGLIPGVGEIADGVNGLISLARGDYLGASLSFAAMIPFAGWAATTGKFARHADGAVALGRRALATTSSAASSLITPARSRAAKAQILAVLNAGDANARRLAADIGNGSIAMHFRRLEQGTLGLYTGATTRSGAPILYVDSHFAFGTPNQIAEAAVTVVHEAQHLADDVAGLFATRTDRMLELRAFTREAAFANSIGMPHLSDFGMIRASQGLRAAAKWMDNLYGF